jgi:hypothetical protein
MLAGLLLRCRLLSAVLRTAHRAPCMLNAECRGGDGRWEMRPRRCVLCVMCASRSRCTLYVRCVPCACASARARVRWAPAGVRARVAAHFTALSAAAPLSPAASSPIPANELPHDDTPAPSQQPNFSL